MGCASESSLQRFLDGTLSPPAAVALEEHLGACDACRELLAETARSSIPEGEGAPVQTDDGPLKKLGRYDIEGPLGAGGMGIVYAARDAKLDRRVALKLLRPEARGLVLREARAMARLQHPNVIAVYDVGESGEQAWVAMELVEGPTLAAWLRQERRPPAQVLDAFLAAARGLQAAHEAGMVHRDFKPDNVLVGNDGRVRVTDFGLALPSSARESGSGTARYMAPEQRRGEPADARADIYSFCVALREALPSAPVDRGLAEDPARRFASMAELIRVLERVRHAPRRRLLLAIGAGALGVLMALAGVVLQQRRELSSLQQRKAELDARIAATLGEMQRESDPARLRTLESQLTTLEQPAQEADAKLRGKGQLATPDRLDAHIAELLEKFGAATYAVPPDFKARLRHHIDRIRAAKGLPAARERMASFLPAIQRELSARSLPIELAYVVWTESRFDPAAKSPSGSLGIWQFTDFTARRYGLRVGDGADERRDVQKSSHAAAGYLADLLADFGSDAFMLALASYNMGEGKLRSILHQLAQEPGGLQRQEREFWHLYRRKLLPAETMEYVPSVLAAAIAFSHPRDYGL